MTHPTRCLKAAVQNPATGSTPASSGSDFTRYTCRYIFKSNRCHENQLKIKCGVLERLQSQASHRASKEIERVRTMTAEAGYKRQGFGSFTSCPFTSMTYDNRSNWRLTPILPVSLNSAETLRKVQIPDNTDSSRSSFFITTGYRPVSAIAYGEGRFRSKTFRPKTADTIRLFPNKRFDESRQRRPQSANWNRRKVSDQNIFLKRPRTATVCNVNKWSL